jgi:hypothetical protein
MGRPRRLNGSRTRVVNLDAKAHDQADRLPNFSAWVRTELHALADGEEKLLLSEVPTRRLAAIIMNRVQRMEYEAESDDDPEAPTEELKAVAAAILRWFEA